MAGESGQPPRAILATGQGFQQPLGVGMAGMFEQCGHRSLLHPFSGVHHQHAIAHSGHYAQIVGNEQHGRAEIPPQGAQQVQDLGLDGHIQGRGGLIENQHIGLGQQRHGDHHALAHAAGQFMGILVEPARGIGDAHRVEHAQGRAARLAA